MAKPPCLTQGQAEKRWPDQHLYWRSEHHCWTNDRHQHEFADPPARRPISPPPPDKPDWASLPSRVAADIAAPGAATEVFFPTLHQGDFLAARPLMVIKQPWFDPTSMLRWPVILDVDRQFRAWDARIGN